MEHAIDLTPFYENFRPKTVLNGSIIELKDTKKYRAEKWMKGDSHCFVFVCITPKTYHIFAAKPSHVENAIKTNKINVIKYI